MLGWAALAAMAGYAVFGGEYGTRSVVRLSRQVEAERARIAQLRHEVDSLARLEHALRTDPATQERVARELYGMIRPGELLYQVVPRDSAKRRL